MLKILLVSSLLLVGCNTSNTNIKTLAEPASSTVVTNRCELKPETGHCRAMFRHYYFDEASKSCKEFVYGGCGGVVPFKTLENCKSTCK
ncbi:MAG TPA: alpha-1-antitrypsin [Campylobacterales bacterium]|nr:alpha-1-antitrypsin [Campylobacterales bacterium]